MTETETLTVYATKYALSLKRIHVIQAAPRHSDSSYVSPVGDRWAASYKLGRDAFTDRATAIAAATAARDKKVTSLRKQIKTLEALNFEDSTP